MPSTFLDLTNKLLRRLNEAQLTETSFVSARNLHASAKDFIIDAIDEIQSKEPRWSFNADNTSQVLTVGQELYDFNLLTTVVDWESFCIQKDDTLSVRTTPLVLINQDEWYKLLRPRDDDAGVDGVRLPKYVFQAHQGKFGISPSPDKTYTVTYDRFIKPARMVNYDDTSTIPSHFDYVILDHALMMFNMHKDNAEQTQLSAARAANSLSTMRMAALNRQDRMTDTRTNTASNRWYWSGNYHE